MRTHKRTSKFLHKHIYTCVRACTYSLACTHTHLNTPRTHVILRLTMCHHQVARSFSAVFGLGLSKPEEMEIAFQGEILTPSKCGECQLERWVPASVVSVNWRGGSQQVWGDIEAQWV